MQKVDSDDLGSGWRNLPVAGCYNTPAIRDVRETNGAMI